MPRALIDRLQRFREGHFRRHEADYRELASGGQHPSLLFIGCSGRYSLSRTQRETPVGGVGD